MLEALTSNEFEYKRLTEEEQQKRGILGRLVGVIADSANPTRNGRKYGKQLWDTLFNSPIMKERIENRCCFGELGHPADREETDLEKIAICLAEVPKYNKKGQLCGVFDILNTPNGKILKALCDYGCNIGVSSRGSGDLITDFDGQESVDPDSYTCEGWDAVLIPAVKEARPKYVMESLNKKRYNKTLRESLQNTLNNASEDDKKIMQEALDSMGINLEDEEIMYYPIYSADGENGMSSDDCYPVDVFKGTLSEVKDHVHSLNQEYKRDHIVFSYGEGSVTNDFIESAEDEDFNLIEESLESAPEIEQISQVLDTELPEELSTSFEIDVDDYAFNYLGDSVEGQLTVILPRKKDKKSLWKNMMSFIESKVSTLGFDEFRVHETSRVTSDYSYMNNDVEAYRISYTLYNYNDMFEALDEKSKIKLERACKDVYYKLKDMLFEGENAQVDNNIQEAFKSLGGNVSVDVQSADYIKYDGSVSGYTIKGSVNRRNLKGDLNRLAEDLTMAYNVANGGEHEYIPNFIRRILNVNKSSVKESLNDSQMRIYSKKFLDCTEDYELFELINEIQLYDPDLSYKLKEIYQPDNSVQSNASSISDYLFNCLDSSTNESLKESLIDDYALVITSSSNESEVGRSVCWGSFEDCKSMKDLQKESNPDKSYQIMKMIEVDEDAEEETTQNTESENTEDINSNELDINEEPITDDNDMVVEQLQKALSEKLELEQKVMELQEKLSVNNVKDAESGEKILNLISELSVSNARNKALATKVESLEKENDKKLQLTESISKKKTAKLQSDLDSLKESYESKLAEANKRVEIKEKEYSTNLQRSKKVNENLRKKVNEAVNRYIELQSVRLGIDSKEITNRLNENFTFDDIDKLCEQLQDYSLTLTGLPVDMLSERYSTIKAKKSAREPLLNIYKNPDDEIDEQLRSLMNGLL